MDPEIDLEQTITDAVNDAQFTDTDVSDLDTSSEVDVDTPVEPETPTEPVEAPAESSTDSTVPSPASQTTTPEIQDAFEKLVGMPAVGVAGRENRIPYSRVKKITEKAVNEIAETALGRKLNPGEKAADVVKAHVAQLPALQSRITDYETRLNTVGEFEDVMANQPQRFLQMLAKVPAYKDFFDLVERAYNAENQAAGRTAPLSPNAQSQQQAVGVTPDQQIVAGDPMPEPNEPQPDGTAVYNMEGLKGLLAWQARQVEAKITKQFEDRYKPIESEWQERKRIDAMRPVIQAQIAEANTWPLFKENEDEIAKVLELDNRISLEAAYRKVVFPKLTTERNKMRESLMEEIRRAPATTAVAPRAATKPVPAENTGPKSLEDIIRESIQVLKK